MSKELFVSSTPHQTKVALVENDQLSEVYFERENEYTLAGSIYKGRVTRVLPGMQSAFVDIGLERDAFLYVSDFFEMEDEDETFEPIPAKPYEVKPSEPAPEPVQLSRNEPASTKGEFEGGFSDDGVNETESNGGNGRAESGAGGRRWRGRRRRRGGRERGFPEQKFAHPENGAAEAEGEGEPTADIEAVAEERPTEEAPKYKPIILPGESIAKWKSAASEGEPSEAVSESGEAAEAEQPQREERSRDGRRDRRPRWGRDRGDRNRDRDRGRDRDREISNEPEAERPYAPIVLPGESISKYRNVQPRVVEAETAAEADAQQEESVSSYSEPPAFEAPTEVEAAPRDEAAVIPPIVEEEEIEQAHENPLSERYEESQRQPKPEAAHRFEQMNVASTFGGTALEPESEVESEDETEETHEFSVSDTAPQKQSGAETEEETYEAAPTMMNEEASQEHEVQGAEAHELPSYHSAAPGSFEEEEFEADEEDDLPHPAESIYEPEDYEELEEETLEPMEYAAAELVQAMNETGAIREIRGGYEGEEGDENGELDEIERAAYAEIGEPEAASAELRGSAATAGYQQRTQQPQRPDFDRRRGRRGGRRLGRGGPRRESMQRQHVMISDVLKEGQEVLIQIAKEPIGKKGARITSHIALPGRFLVYMPTTPAFLARSTPTKSACA
jgi:Ribonuclease G/E